MLYSLGIENGTLAKRFEVLPECSKLEEVKRRDALSLKPRSPRF